jgi:hypothetical protein
VKTIRSTKTSAIERMPIGWTYPIEKDSVKITKSEPVRIEKVDQLFRDNL